MNVIVTCPRCGEDMLVHAKSLEWIRCKRCHKGVNVAENVQGAVSKHSIHSTPRVPLKGRGERK
ncbi:hypothetical protein ES703_06919 [subsurface metagenome]